MWLSIGLLPEGQDSRRVTAVLPGPWPLSHIPLYLLTVSSDESALCHPEMTLLCKMLVWEGTMVPSPTPPGKQLALGMSFRLSSQQHGGISTPSIWHYRKMEIPGVVKKLATSITAILKMDPGSQHPLQTCSASHSAALV